MTTIDPAMIDRQARRYEVAFAVKPLLLLAEPDTYTALYTTARENGLVSPQALTVVGIQVRRWFRPTAFAFAIDAPVPHRLLVMSPLQYGIALTGDGADAPVFKGVPNRPGAPIVAGPVDRPCWTLPLRQPT